MIRQAHDAGVAAALARYGVKEAAIPWGKVWGGAKGALDYARQMIVGKPEELLQGRKIFSAPSAKNPAGGYLNWRNVFWPTVKNEAGKTDWLPTMVGRGFGSILPAYGVYQAAKGEYGDPNEGRLSNTLGAVGAGLAGAFAYPVGGMIGGGAAMALGDTLGKGVGHMLGSRPQIQQPYALPPPPFSGGRAVTPPAWAGGPGDTY